VDVGAPPRPTAFTYDAQTNTDGTMRRRVPRLVAAALLTAWSFAFLGSVATAQTATITIPPASAPAPARTAEIGSLLRQGQQLEAERRWGDALAHYEEALRSYPGDASLERRFDLARMHYDLGRRYADQSFVNTATQLSLPGALDLYTQVLLKIQAHHVDVPDWKGLVEQGAAGFGVALSEPAFVSRHLPHATSDDIEQFRRELREASGRRAVASRGDARDAVAEVASLARHTLRMHPTPVVLEYLCGASSGLDHYSAYLTPDQLGEIYSQIEGNFVGLGIELKSNGEGLLIVRVIPGSPAAAAGIQAGDLITMVDGQSTLGLSTDQAADLLQGADGSTADLVVVTGGQSPRRVRVRRERVEVPSIDQQKILDRQRGVAYLRLTCFQKTTARDLDAALWALYRQGMRSLIMDLRGNPGGLLVSAVEAADRFVERGVIVSTRGRSLQEDFTYKAHEQGTWRVPLVVLIDRDSASAAEIFAGAIRDHRRGVVVGERSFGKGSVQGIFPLVASESGLRLTTAKFYSPMGKPFCRVGVEPDVMVHLTARPINGEVQLPIAAEDDAMLNAALDAARDQLARRQ
jgi:carboxyl-terminal processing protease